MSRRHSAILMMAAGVFMAGAGTVFAAWDDIGGGGSAPPSGPQLGQLGGTPVQVGNTVYGGSYGYLNLDVSPDSGGGMTQTGVFHTGAPIYGDFENGQLVGHHVALDGGGRLDIKPDGGFKTATWGEASTPSRVTDFETGVMYERVGSATNVSYLGAKPGETTLGFTVRPMDTGGTQIIDYNAGSSQSTYNLKDVPFRDLKTIELHTNKGPDIVPISGSWADKGTYRLNEYGGPVTSTISIPIIPLQDRQVTDPTTRRRGP